MKAIHWLVLVIACASPPCLWSACQTEESNNDCPVDIEQECLNFSNALGEERVTCYNWGDLSSDEQIERGAEFTELYNRCLDMGSWTCFNTETYHECVSTGIGCDMEEGEVVVWGACMTIIGAE